MNRLSTCFSRTVRASAALVIAGTLASTALANPIEIAGSTTVHKAIIEPVGGAAKTATGIEVKMLPVGTGRGLQMLAEGRVPLAAVSDSLEDSIAAAKKGGLAQVPGNLKMHTMYVEKLVPILHPDNPVKALTRDQLRGLLTGKISNWKELGGTDAPVTVVVPAPGSGTRGAIDKMILDGQAVGDSVKVLRTATAELAEVARDRNAIGIVGDGAASSMGGKVKEIVGPDVSRPLGFVTVGDPTPEVAKLLGWLKTPEAQKLFIK